MKLSTDYTQAMTDAGWLLENGMWTNSKTDFMLKDSTTRVKGSNKARCYPVVEQIMDAMEAGTTPAPF